MNIKQRWEGLPEWVKVLLVLPLVPLLPVAAAIYLVAGTVALFICAALDMVESGLSLISREKKE